jgi:hypothetical protein
VVEARSDSSPAPTPGSPASGKPASSPLKRYLKIGLPILVLGAIAFYFLFPRIELTIAINGLHALDPRARGANAEKLKTYPDRDLVVDMLVDAVQDDDRSFEVRLICARMLIDPFERISRLDALLKSGDLSTRAAVLKALSLKPYFQRTYVDDPGYPVRETVAEWLAREGDLTRFHAIQMAVKLDMREQLPAIRTMLNRSGSAAVHAQEERDVIIAAAGAMRHFGVCDAVPDILSVARSDPDPLVRLRFMQVADDMSFRNDREVPCPGAAAEEVMASVVQDALSDSDHAVRMGAALILARRPDWSAAVLPRVREILDGDFSGAERRHALEVLVSSQDPADQERIPLYFHDRDTSVRSTAAAQVALLPELRLEGCLIGLIGAETESDQLFIDAVGVLRRIAKKWVGLPTAWGLKAVQDPAGFKGDLRTLFTRGQVGEVTREGLTEAWFEWWCDQLQLEAAQKDTAIAARKAFWAAMASRDTQAAAAALEALDFDVPGLFSYERAWLEARRP